MRNINHKGADKWVHKAIFIILLICAVSVMTAGSDMQSVTSDASVKNAAANITASTATSIAADAASNISNSAASTAGNTAANAVTNKSNTAESSALASESESGNSSSSNNIDSAITGDKSDYMIYSINFIDQNYGFAIRYNYNTISGVNRTMLLSTKDGGISWNEYEIKDAVLRKIDFIDKLRGWAVAQSGNQMSNGEGSAEYEILYTKDGGIHWTVQTKLSAGDSEAYDITFQDTNHGYAILCGTMFITKNGGTKWDKVTFPVKNFEVQHLSFDNSEKGWVIGRVSDVTKKENNIESAKYTLYILNTSDGGSSWKKQFTQTYKDQNVSGIDIDFVNSRTGWFLTSNLDTWNGDLYYTSNAGRNWRKINEIKCIRPTPQELSFITAKIGWIPLNVGAGPISGGFLYTNDGGKTFSSIGNDYGIYSLESVDFVSDLEGWAAGNNVSYGDYIIHTKDGGKTWEQVYPTLSPTIDISFTDNQNGFGLGALTDQKALLRSFDGGSTWKSIYTFPENCLPSAISFTDQSNGWALTTDETGTGAIWNTQDGGFTWTELNKDFTIQPYFNLQYFHFLNKTDGIIITDDSNYLYYYRTTDGGVNWKVTKEKETGSIIKYQFSFSTLDDGWKIETKDKLKVEAYYCKNGADWMPMKKFEHEMWSYGAVSATNEKGWLLVWDQALKTGVRFQLLYTEDAWKKYITYNFPQGVDLEAFQSCTPMQFTDNLHGWILATNGLLRTQDGGKSWVWVN